jgi:hypothetical protein
LAVTFLFSDIEALLLPDDLQVGHTELSCRFRLHGAHYVASSKSQRRAVATELADVYKLRSRLVHGRKYPTHDQIGLGRDVAERLARRALIRAVYENFPTAAEFRDLALGVQTDRQV